MSTQNTLHNILQVRSRGRARHVIKLAIDDLSREWTKTLHQQPLVDELVPARIVTLLEVFARGWIEQLVDHGSPFLERAAELKLDLKFDYKLAAILHGGTITLGQLVAHTISTSRLEAIKSIFDKLIDDDIFNCLARISNRWDVEVLGKPPVPIIPDIDRLKRDLFKLFEVRNILVHELPKTKPISADDVNTFLQSATLFIEATEEYLSQLLHGQYPLTQRAMNEEAIARSDEALLDLLDLCVQIAKDYGAWGAELAAVQAKWNEFRLAEAEWRSNEVRGGSMQPMLFALASEELARSRIKDLREWVERGKAGL
ncbi:lysozyme inhibitor LprI family protein [Bradyrhizobium sp. SZCCHNR1075]|uniref:lysozyme inhibitor LprI family protein n=1 Tax=Bradyrhizobium sp. SZCCHNR1075 TaxID=3057362 RepID=UPI0028F0ABE3|nr:lysozyme inhibitor LprI family protein [Bradyrhizobium sp. SZCCHNR1075]